jgi:GNAT superfamily N-acetyltransferase
MTDLFATLASTWPAAETRDQAGWILRRGEGGGNRVSAATRAASGADPAVAEAAMRAWGQRPLFQIRPGDRGLDAALEARGYARRDATLMLAAASADLAARAPDERAIPCAAPLAYIEEIWAAGGIGPARLAVMRRAPDPKLWLLGRAEDRPVGAGFVGIADGVAMLHALEVAPAARGKGLGGVMSRAAAAWALRMGAPVFALAVTEANAPARALYARLGLAEAARYHYRVAPEGDRP